MKFDPQLEQAIGEDNVWKLLCSEASHGRTRDGRQQLNAALAVWRITPVEQVLPPTTTDLGSDASRRAFVRAVTRVNVALQALDIERAVIKLANGIAREVDKREAEARAARDQRRTAQDDGTENGQDVVDQRPELDAGDMDLPRIVYAAWNAVARFNAADPRVFGHGTDIVLVHQPKQDMPRLHALGESAVRGLLARVAHWVEATTLFGVPLGAAADALPPLHVVRDMLAFVDKPLPYLGQVVTAPTFTPDGELIQQPGFDQDSGLFYAPPKGFELPEPVPSRPSRDDVERAKHWWLDELLGQFPFVGNADKAHALSLGLDRFCRLLVDGPTPLRLIAKSTPGTGATLLAEVLLTPALGNRIPSTTEARTEDEWRKRVSAIVREGLPILYVGNLRHNLESAALSEALTQTSWSDRVLGRTGTFTGPIHQTFIATGNNPVLSDEIARRTVPTWLDAGIEKPWERTDWKHDPLRGWVQTERARGVWAAATLIQSWLVAGRPAPKSKLPVLGSFESWSRVHGGLLEHIGVPDFLANRASLFEDTDQRGETQRAFVTLWWDTFLAEPKTTSDLAALAIQAEFIGESSKGEQSPAERLGYQLRQARDRVIRLLANEQVERPEAVRVRRGTQKAGRRQWLLETGVRPSGSPSTPAPDAEAEATTHTQQTKQPQTMSFMPFMPFSETSASSNEGPSEKDMDIEEKDMSFENRGDVLLDEPETGAGEGHEGHVSEPETTMRVSSQASPEDVDDEWVEGEL